MCVDVCVCVCCLRGCVDVWCEDVAAPWRARERAGAAARHLTGQWELPHDGSGTWGERRRLVGLATAGGRGEVRARVIIESWVREPAWSGVRWGEEARGGAMSRVRTRRHGHGLDEGMRGSEA